MPTSQRGVRPLLLSVALLFVAGTVTAEWVRNNAQASAAVRAGACDTIGVASMLVAYFEEMSVPKPFVVRQGTAFARYRREVRQKLLEKVSLSPLPGRIPLEVRRSVRLDHPWCTVRRVYYLLWPGVYASGLLYLPKELRERPAPAMLCPHGHWPNGNAFPDEQKRCLVFAKRGYVVFSPSQYHYEDLSIGVSNQTLHVWNNMRALDYLQSLPEVDTTRIGCSGVSGGGLQTQMLAALDERVKAATIVGMTCDFREILSPYGIIAAVITSPAPCNLPTARKSVHWPCQLPSST